MTAEDAIDAFRQAIPREWVKRVETPDYGIDVDVEIRDTGENLTGLRFHAQVKGTASEANSEIYRYYYELSDLEYFRHLAQPVLLVRYSASKGFVLARWAHGVHLKPGHGEPPRVRVDYDDSMILTREGSRTLIDGLLGFRYWKERVPELPLVIATQVEEDVRRSSRATKALQNSSNKPADVFRFRAGSPAPGELGLRFAEHKMIVSAADVSSMSVDLPARPEGMRDDYLIRLTRLLAAIVLDQLGRHELASKVLGSRLEFILIEVPDVAHRVAELLLRVGRTDDVFVVWDRLIAELLASTDESSDAISVFVAIIASVFHLGPETLDPQTQSGIIERLARLADVLDESGAHEDAAQVVGALARVYFELGSFRDSLRAYIRAAHLDPKLRDAVEWQRDLATCLFESGRYRAAERTYECIFDRDHLAATLCRKADTQLHDGRYHDAATTFDEALELSAEEGQAIESWWLLRSYVAIMAHSFRESQARDTDAAVAALEDTGVEAAFDRDLLCAAAWSKEGKDQKELGNSSEALSAFMIAASLGRQRDDLISAVELALQQLEPDDQGVPSPILVLIDVGMHRHGIFDFIEELRSTIAESQGPAQWGLSERLESILKTMGAGDGGMPSGHLWMFPESRDKVKDVADAEEE